MPTKPTDKQTDKLTARQFTAILRISRALAEKLEKSAARSGREGGAMLSHAASEHDRACGVGMLMQAIEAELSEEG